MEIQAKDSPNFGRGIPIDLLIDIFSRVPAKNIARCRCVSKLWRSILCRPDFMEVFLTMSSTHRRMFLFTIEDKNNLYFFSAPEPENPDENTCLVVPATRYHVLKKHSFNDVSSLHGFVILKIGDTMVIRNPVTGESVSLPEVEHTFKPLLGYDPIDNQFKVLCVLNKSHENLVLTLDNENHLWRRNQCQPHHHCICNEICIDGILYYPAYQFSTDGFDWEKMVSKIVCFHVRSENFSYINKPEEMIYPTLINYKGKLAALELFQLHTASSHLDFWVLEDAEKHIWSKQSYSLPPLMLDIANDTPLYTLGMTGRGEVVFRTFPELTQFYIYYFNLETNHITRIHMQGLEEFQRYSRIYTFLGYAENLKLMCPARRP